MSQVRMPLEVLRVGSPCTQDWNAMAGDDRRRFCAGCGLHVHNLSAMPRDEAERLVCEAAGRLCVRFERTFAGQIVTLDYEKRPDKLGRWKFWSLIGGLGAAAAAIAAAVNPLGNRGGNWGATAVMGDMAFPTPPPPMVGPPAQARNARPR